MRKRKLLIFVPLAVLIIFGLTFIPHKAVKIDSSNVSKIIVFNGTTGDELEITKQSEIQYIIDNLNEVTFRKGKPSVGFMGFTFRTSFYNKEGKRIKELIINSKDQIRYKGFFYTADDKSIDYQYIENMFENK